MTLSKIRIGVYGASGSGKTTFFRQLVLKNNLPYAPKSKLAQFIAASVSPDGKTIPTTVTVDNVEIKIDRIGYWINDAMGSELSEAVDVLHTGYSAGYSGRNPIARQIRRCDAFLFFFDPTAGGSTLRLLRHHRQELLRAKQIVDHILQTRQNRFMPILFVLTHQDALRCDPDLLRLTEKWIDELAEHIEESYEQLLMGYFPRPLARKEHLFLRVAPLEAQGADDLLDVLDKTQSLVDLGEQFWVRDRQRSGRFVLAFLICSLLLIFAPIIILASPAAKSMWIEVRERVQTVLKHLPTLPGALSSGEASALSEAAIDLQPLFDGNFNWEPKKVAALHQSLFILMNRLNRLEDDGRDETEDYRMKYDLWSQAFADLDGRFDAEPAETSEQRWDKLKRFSKILSDMTDSPTRTTPKLNGLLQKYWALYRQSLVEAFRVEIRTEYTAGTDSRTLLELLCGKLERVFREVSESTVRGDSVSKAKDLSNFALGTSTSGLNRANSKETLKQDIRMAFIASRNFSDRYPLDIRIRSVAYESDTEFTHDYDYRLLFYGGKDKGEIAVPLTESSPYGANKIEFLPSRQDFSLAFDLDKPLHLELQQKLKEENARWMRQSVWEFKPDEHRSIASLKPLGVLFYLRYENEENTVYALANDGFRIDLVAKRPRSVPEFLWEIADIDLDRNFQPSTE